MDAILEAAAQVFEREGYARATTDRIAERAGVSIGSLYQYFPGKDAILATLAEQHADAGLARIRDLLSTAGGIEGLARMELRQLLQLFVEDLLELHQTQPRLQRLMFLETPPHPDGHARLSRAEDELAAEIAALLRAHPEVSIARPDLAAWMVVHVTHGLIHDFIVHPPPRSTSRAQLVGHVVCLLEAYLRSGTPPAAS
ncbi:MAG: TetR family transcriptional regulator [Deltaproteobacteria bacterium]|nr:TetR family transcriptional regulator [Deltaproteobacteria bacterium]MBW2534454.1 TetR family transcriptional regulator [Deltaproteobacteria bacterium]